MRRVDQVTARAVVGRLVGYASSSNAETTYLAPAAGVGQELSVAVCLLWSVANAAHEQRIGELIEECLPGVPYTLSHRLNPIVREYRRASDFAAQSAGG